MRRIAPLLLAILLGLVVAAPARANLFSDVLQDYVTDSKLDTCKYTQDELKKLKDLVPVDQNAYSADFVAALDDAMARRAEGACNPKKQSQQLAPVAPPAVTGVQPPPPPPSTQGQQPATQAPAV